MVPISLIIIVFLLINKDERKLNDAKDESKMIDKESKS